MFFQIVARTLPLVAVIFCAATVRAQDASPPKTTMGGPPEIYSSPTSPSRGLKERGAPSAGTQSNSRSGAEKPCNEQGHDRCKKNKPLR